MLLGQKGGGSKSPAPLLSLNPDEVRLAMSNIPLQKKEYWQGTDNFFLDTHVHMLLVA